MPRAGELGHLVDEGHVPLGAHERYVLRFDARRERDRPRQFVFDLLHLLDVVARQHVIGEMGELALVVGQADDDAVACGGVPDLAVNRVVLAQTEVDAAGNEINASASVQLVSSMATWAVARSR